MFTKNNGDEDSFIHKARRWRWSYWLAAATLAILWSYAVYEIVNYLLIS